MCSELRRYSAGVERTKQTCQRVKNTVPGAVVEYPPAGVSLVAQWLRIRLPMQGTRVRALVWEDPTCRGAAGPVSHNC